MNITFARASAAAVLVLSLVAAGCGSPDVDIAKAVKVGDVTTGWFDVGIVDGQNKLVPTAVFTVTNTGTETLSGLQVFTVFRFIGETEELGSGVVVLRGSDALAPNATSKPITVRANWGFSGLQPRAQMLMHSQFKDARAEIFAKFGAKPFVKIGEAQIARQLLTK
ncbi:MAG: hypothetical protein MUE61_09875 [Vicinamibacterales bacterium]|jgi:hypothetical protein|nr:hypothetical protein [Vicinamibacterales bacterium]